MNSVPAYVSSDDETTEAPVKKKRVERIWTFKRTFELAAKAETHVSDLKIWTKHTEKRTIRGQKVTYRCNQVPWKNRTSCSVGVYLLYHSENAQVSLFMADTEHTNHVIVSKGLPPDLRKNIQTIFDEGTTRPNAILATLRSRGVEEPRKTQLLNFLSQYRKQKYGPASVSAHALKQWCDSRNSVPEDPDAPFVLNYNISTDLEMDRPELQIFMTTKRLLKLAICNSFIQTDTTYKLVWQGFPVLMVGTSDKNRVFHPFGISVCYSETSEDFEFIFKSLKEGLQSIMEYEYKPNILMGDASAAITNGFERVFGTEYIRHMCWFHVIKKVDEKLRPIEKVIREKIRENICQLQLANCKEEFDYASDLFIDKWKSRSCDKVLAFIAYFKHEWLDQNRLWYEGAAIGAPSTNNGIESTNGVIKKLHTFRERLPVGQFLSFLETNLLAEWSRARDKEQTNNKSYAESMHKSLELWTKSYQWASSSPKLLSKNEARGAQTLYYVLSSAKAANGNHGEISQQVVDNWQHSQLKWSTFDEFKHFNSLLWVIKVDESNWENSSCNCPYFLKKSQCKHVVGLSIRLRLIQAPQEAKKIPLGQKRKRGRPARAKPALLRQ